MQLPPSEEDKENSRAHKPDHMSTVRDTIIFLTCTVVGLAAAGIALLILRVAWSLLLLALRAMGEI